MGVSDVGGWDCCHLNLSGGVSHFGEGWFGFVSDSLLSVQLSTDFEEQVHYGGQNAEQGSRSHRIARGVK